MTDSSLKQVKHFIWIVTKVMMLLLVMFFLLAFTANYYIVKSAKGELYSNINDIPSNYVGMILGTSPYTSDGQRNQHYYRRLDAIVELLKANKIKYILVSGDRSESKYYNEPSRIRKDLIKRGVSPDIIYSDYEGYRTLNSVLRAKKIFGLSQLTIVSQRYHNERALYIALHNNIKAVAWNAKGLIPKTDYANRFREFLARTLAFIEVSIFEREPSFPEAQIKIGQSPPN